MHLNNVHSLCFSDCHGLLAIWYVETSLTDGIYIAGAPCVGDVSRGIKPFSSTRPLGITVPHMAFGNNSGAIIPGPKPIAITTPQPHNPPMNTKSQSVSDTTVSVTISNQSISSTCNQGYSVSQSNYSNTYHGQIMSKTLGVAKAMSQNFKNMKANPAMIERYMLQNPEGFPGHLLSGPNMIHPDILSGFSCSQCPKVFKTKAAMKLHTTVHKTTEERQYGCQVCQRRFLHRHHLVVHQRKHSGEKPFKCNACSKTFMAIFLLHKHLRKHSRETGPISEMSILQLKQLQEQKLINTGPQPLTYNNVPPLLQRQEPVIVLDDDGSQSKVRTQKGLDKVKRKVGEVIGEVNKDPSHTGVVLPVKSISNHPGCSKERKSSKVVSNNLTNVQEIPKDKNSTVPNVNKEIAELVKEKLKTENITNTDQSVPILKVESNSRIVSVKEGTKDTGKTVDVKAETVVNPFPEYTSDDEVELDFNTGELIVKKDKKKDDKVKETSSDKTGIDEAEERTVEVKKETETRVEAKKETETESRVESEVDKKETVTIYSRQVSQGSITDTDDDKPYEVSVIAEWNKIEDTNDIVSAHVDQESEVENKVEDSDKDEDGGRLTIVIEDDSVSDVKAEIKDTVDDMTNKVCSAIEQRGEHVNHGVELHSESKELKGVKTSRKGPTNIFEKMYESVQDRSVLEKGKSVLKKGIVKGKKGKKKGRKVKCEVCSRSFHSSHYLLLHMAVHKRNPMLQSLKKAKANQMKALGFVNKVNVACEVCNKVFKFQKSLNSHMRVHSEKLIERKLYRKAFRDFVSGGNPQSIGKRDKHSRQSVGNESQEKISETKGRLSLESSTSDTSDRTERTMSCSDVCDDDPPIKIIMGADNVKRYLCHACDNTYTTKQKLRLHALIHKDNCFLCDICGKSFFRQLTLEKHISTHKLPRPHICELCKKSFIHRSSLMRHKSAHQKPVNPNSKLNVADINFELKMRNTYSMLKEERLQQIQQQFPKSENPEALPKYDPLDLTVKISRPEEQSLPPVLSPANISTSSQPSSWNLSPPLITEDPVNVRHCERVEDVEMEPIKERIEMLKSAKLTVKRKGRTESGCSESDVLSSDGNTPAMKKSRKTRVYQTSCRVCKEAFPNVMMLKTHMSVHNTVETHLYECHICRHRFTQSCSLLRHLKTSCQENRMKCVPCNKTFHRRNTFEQHMRLHEGGPSTLDGSFYNILHFFLSLHNSRGKSQLMI